MKNQLDKVNPMIRIMTAALLVGLTALPVHAQATYGVGARYVDLDTQGSRGQVQEYDGKLYYVGHGDVSVSNQGAKGLFDIEINDIGSTEENGSAFIDAGGFKSSLTFDRISHRQNVRNYVLMINGFSAIAPNGSGTGKVLRPGFDWNLLVKRTEADLKLGYYDPANSARFLAGQYRTVSKKGDYGFGVNANFLVGDVNNEAQDIAASVGTNVGEEGAVAIEVLRREFRDYANHTADGTRAINPILGNTQLTSAEMTFRYNAGKDLAVTGALTGRQRENQFNGYKVNAAVGALNAAYKASEKLALTAKLYSRIVEVDENNGWQSVVKDAGHGNPLGLGQGNQFDKTTVKGEFVANYQPVEKTHLKAGYKMELTHRRDAEHFVYDEAWYTDGVIIATGAHMNFITMDDVKHIFNIAAKAELPLDIEVEADFKHLRANRPAFVNRPTRSNQASLGVFVPLPAHLHLSLMADYLKEHNSVAVSQYHQTRRGYRAGLDWQHDNKMFFGTDASFEDISYFTEGWFGQSSQIKYDAAMTIAKSKYMHEGGMKNHTRNTTAGLHSRINLPKGFVVLGNGSYTWSVVQTPVHLDPKTDVGSYVGDLTPGDVRIARGVVGVEYTPERFKDLTAKASYRVDHWVDKIDAANSGRASIASLGASMKF